MNDLVKLTAREAVGMLARREASPLELVDAAVEHIAETDAAVNALPTLAIERERARELIASVAHIESWGGVTLAKSNTAEFGAGAFLSILS